MINLSVNNLAVGGRRIHYAWVMVVLAASMRFLSSSFRSSSSILLPRIVEIFGWSHGQVGAGFALQWVVSGLFGPPAGWMGERYGFRLTMCLGTILLIVGMILTGMMTQLWQFYLYFGVILSVSMAIFQVPLTVAVTQWFRKHLGVGMGLLQSSQGLGPVITVPVILLIYTGFGGGIPGLRAAFLIPGIGGGLLLLLLIRFFYSEPAQVGMRPLGADEDEPIQRQHTGEYGQARTKVFLRQAQRTSAFWNLIGIHYWGCAGHAIILVFLVALAEERGVSEVMAAAAFIILQVTSTLTRFAVPVLADRMGSKGVMGACFFLQVAPVVILFFAQDAWLFHLFAVLFGIGFGGEMTAFPIINRQYYGRAPVGITYGWQMMGAGLGMASGAVLGGFMRDLTGGFTMTIALSLVLSLAGVVSLKFQHAPHTHQLPDWEDALPAEYRSTTSPSQGVSHGD